MYLENVNLPYYTEKEDKANSISHLVGVVFGAIATVVLLMRSNDISHIISSIIFGVAMIILYSGSSIYHRLSPGKAKRVARLVDHSVIFVLITGTSIPLMILDVLPYYKALAIVCIAVSVVTAMLGITLTFIDQEKYKKLQMVLYMVLGWMCIFLFYPIYKCDPTARPRRCNIYARHNLLFNRQIQKILSLHFSPFHPWRNGHALPCIFDLFVLMT